MADPFDFERPPARYAVMGHPVSHSKSPFIHAQFARQTGIRLEYTAIDVDPGGFAQAVGNFHASGGNGLNVTVPFKLEAWRLADRRSPRADLAGAVNTLRFDAAGQVFGDNTDGAGLLHDLEHNLQVPLRGRRVLVLGAGGAVRGVLGPLLEAGADTVYIANRTPARALELASHFRNPDRLQAGGFGTIPGAFDVVINGTAASLGGEVPPIPQAAIAAGALAYDMMYGPAARPFLDRARALGAGRITDGLGMLVEQAAESFQVWHGVRPDTGPVLQALRDQLR